MAMSDYYLCDVCNGKCFYDVELNYDRVGQMKAICDTCVKTHRIMIVPRPEMFEDDAKAKKETSV